MNFDSRQHIEGKVYDLTKENMSAMIAEIERLTAEQKRTFERYGNCKKECAYWENIANSWMADYDKLLEKYEPMILVESKK